MIEAALEMSGISKSFPGVVANKGIDLVLRRGEIHALLGENGAGKTTLMKILTGVYRPDEGRISMDGAPVSIDSPTTALRLGIGMVHQHFALVESLTALQNVLLASYEDKLLLPLDECRKELTRLSEQLHLAVDPDARIWQLSMGARQRVEILKLLLRGSRVLVLDEPTSVLTPNESAHLFRLLRTLADDGAAIVFISHKLGEVMRIADRITVLRRGEVVGTLAREEASLGLLARMMVGREMEPPPAPETAPGDLVLLHVDGLAATDDRGLDALRGLSLDVHEGEIVGLAGVAGNGQRELCEAIVGLRRVDSGSVEVAGRTTTNRGPGAAYSAGLAYIPEKRVGEGLVPSLSIVDNAILRHYAEQPIARGP